MNILLPVLTAAIVIGTVTFSSLQIKNNNKNLQNNTNPVLSQRNINQSFEFYYPVYENTTVSIRKVNFPLTYLDDSKNLSIILNDFYTQFMNVFKATIENQNFSSTKLYSQIPYSFTFQNIQPAFSGPVDNFPSTVKNYLKFFQIETNNHYYNYLYNVCLLKLLLEKVMNMNFFIDDLTSKVKLHTLKKNFQNMNQLIVNNSLGFNSQQNNLSTTAFVLLLIFYINFTKPKQNPTAIYSLLFNLIGLITFGILLYVVGYPYSTRSLQSTFGSNKIYSEYDLTTIYENVKSDLYANPWLPISLFILSCVVFGFLLIKSLKTQQN